MDKETLSHYGWVVVVVIIIAILIGCSAPFARAIKDNFIGMTNRLTAEAQEALEGINNAGPGGGGEQGGGSGGSGGNQGGSGGTPLSYTISRPASKNSAEPDYVESGSYTVEGSVADVSTLKSLTVNGTPVTPAADGSWSAPLTLTKDATTEITIVITDNSDNTETETRYVSYVELTAYALVLDNSASETDKVPMIFVNSPFAIAAGDTYNSDTYGELTVTAAYTGFVNQTYSYSKLAPWYNDYHGVITSATFEDNVKPYSMGYWFYECTSLTTVSAIPSGITSMYGTFRNCTSLTTAPVIPNNVTNMEWTFNGCTSLKTYVGSADPTGDFSNYVIPSSVTDMQATFQGCTSLITAPDMSHATSVTSVSGTFTNCTSLTAAPTIPSSVTNMQSTFKGCTSLTTAPVIPESVTNMNYTFQGCTSLTTAPVIPSSVTSMKETFKGCISLTTAPDMSNATSVTNMYSTFHGCTSLTTTPVIPSSVTNMSNAFMSCASLATAPVIPNSVTNMANTFYDCTSLTGNIEINANPAAYGYCFTGTTKPITITGSCSDATKAALAGTTTKGNVTY